ncbi:MAG: glucose-6-phosphate isomerase [Ketobacteraceae bacterium]|nr:glucose-6-phosphate isomerase [Ketobacteraceae bacterium]
MGSVLSDQSLLKPLLDEQAKLENTELKTLFESDPDRFQQFLVQCADLTLDFSKHRITRDTLSHLAALARHGKLQARQSALFKGEIFNETEQRAALHSALRAPHDKRPPEVASDIEETLAKMAEFARCINDGIWKGYTGKPVRRVVNIGIGGSDLGPAMTVNALQAHQHNPDLQFHFVSNIDPTDIQTTLRRCDPETTLFIVASKTFTTLETLSNANTARQWFLEHSGDETQIRKHFVAISTNLEKVKAFGIAPENIFPMWDWVGGRYSIWSAIGLPLCIALGSAGFRQFLEGGHSVDQHFLSAPPEKNAPVIMALLSIWYAEFFNVQSHGILCYEDYLDQFPDYLQQLDMESNGKRVRFDGSTVTYKTGIPVWGNVGSNSQHSFHQLLHQGTITVPVDFIVGVESCNPCGEQHGQLFANCLAQSQALMKGRSLEEVENELSEQGLPREQIRELAPHKVIPGNKPSTTIVYPRLTPSVLGQLVALYEHKVFVQSVIWDINPFDQWGVELGKQMSKDIFPMLTGGNTPDDLDSSTAGLISLYRSRNKKAGC